MLLRTATPEDAEAIAPVHLACWHEAYTGLVPQRRLDELAAQDRVATWRERLQRPEDTTVIATEDEQVVGLATAGLADEPGLPPYALRSLYVVRRRWGRGTGPRLVQEVLGDRPAWLWVFEANERARRSYAKTGWVETGERSVDAWTGVPELRLVRR